MDIVNLENVVKLTQIIFFLTTGALAVLTYLRAKKTILSTVNAEYQKRVMDRLDALARQLYEEFEESSEKHWANTSPVKAAIAEINDTFERHRSEVVVAKEWIFGTPFPDDQRRLHLMLHPIESDPFIPKSIRILVNDFLRNRLALVGEIYGETFDKYANDLANEVCEPVTDLEGLNEIHNAVNSQRYERGVGIAQIEKDVHDIRRAIQSYFESFDPR
jgi:hypothetical protein